MKNQLTKKLVFLCAITTVLFTFSACENNQATTKDQASQNQSTQNQNQSTSSSIQNPKDKTGKQVQPTDNTEAKAKKTDKKIIKAKGLYLTATSAGTKLKHYIELANTTEINSYIIDYKNDYGEVTTNSEVPIAKEIKAIDVRYDAQKVVKELHDNNIYAIARIVCFKDPILAKNKTEFAIKKSGGELYYYNKTNWLDPYNKGAWQYNIDLAKEALQRGFDEVQLDYIRFPDGKKSEMVFADTRGLNFHENINEFLAEARKQMPDAVLSGDIFAIICESPKDTENIGQYFELVGQNLDYLYPMAYPSHYALGQIINGVKFPKPDKDPYGVIKNTLLKAKARQEKIEGHKPILRTFLQDFSATWIGDGNWQYYEDEQIKQQIQAVYDAGFEEWFLWDHMNKYREGAFKKE